MNREEIIRMAREADPGFETEVFHAESIVGMDAIERFAKRVAAAEREACAAICDRFQAREMQPAECAAAIRARGEK